MRSSSGVWGSLKTLIELSELQILIGFRMPGPLETVIRLYLGPIGPYDLYAGPQKTLPDSLFLGSRRTFGLCLGPHRTLINGLLLGSRKMLMTCTKAPRIPSSAFT